MGIGWSYRTPEQAGDEGLMGRVANEIIVNIFENLEPKELFVVAMVCHSWNTISSDDGMWKKFAAKEWVDDTTRATSYKALYFDWLTHPDDHPLPTKNDSFYRVVVSGPSSAGKTTFVRTLQEGKFQQRVSTISPDFIRKEIAAPNGDKISIEMWDTPSGRERFNPIPLPRLFRNADLIVFCFDVASRGSVNELKQWIDEVAIYAAHPIPILAMGTKIDLREKKATRNSEAPLTTQEMMDAAKKHDVKYIECSSKTNEKFDEAVKTIASTVASSRANTIPKCIPSDWLKKLPQIRDKHSQIQDKQQWCIML